MNFTRIFSLLSRARVRLLNALLSGAAQGSHALSPFLLGMATKRFHRTPRRVLQPLRCRVFWGDEVQPTAPRQAASWGPGGRGAGAVNLEGSVAELRGSCATAGCAGVKQRGRGARPPPSCPSCLPSRDLTCRVGGLGAEEAHGERMAKNV